MLILVLFIMAGLAVVCADLSKNVLLDHAFSQGSRACLAAKPVLASGEAIAAHFLVREFQRQGIDKRSNESFAAFSSRFGETADEYSRQLGKFELEMELEDENSRFPLRALFPERGANRAKATYYSELLQRILVALMLEHGYDGGEDEARMSARRFVSSLLNWGGEGRPTNEAIRWYVSQDPPVFPPGRAPESLAEILLVYWPGEEADFTRRVLLGDAGKPGLLENCSVWSRGPMNLNTIRTVPGWGLASSSQQGRLFMEDLEAARNAQGEELKPGWHLDIFSAYGISVPPPSILSTRSRWYRVRIRTRQGAAVNSSELVGWISKTGLTWVSRSVL